MSVSSALVATGAVASLAYLDARTQFSYDFSLIKTLAKSSYQIWQLERKDRCNLFYVLEDHAKAKATANRPYLILEGRSWTYKEVYNTVLKYAAWLKAKYGVAPKEIVALDFMNTPHFIFIWFALWSLGAVPAFINYNLTGAPLLHCIKTSTARLVFTDGLVEPRFSTEVRDDMASGKVRDGKGPVELVVLSSGTESEIMACEAYREPDSSRNGPKIADMSLLIYTSGTTGNPKPAIVSYRKVWTGAAFMKNWMGWKRNDIFYTCMPIYHSTATVLGVIPALIIGSTVCVGHKFSTKNFWPEVRASKSTIIQYVGETCRYLLAKQPQIDPATGKNLDKVHNVRMAFGNGLRPEVWDRFKDRFGIETIAEFYSATEGASASWNLSKNSFSSGAVGRNGKLLEILFKSTSAIVELDWEKDEPKRFPSKDGEFCRQVPRNSPGELLYALDPTDIKKNYQGYFNNDEASNKKIMRDVLKKGDAWFRTGDVIRWDQEGRWWFCDRIGDTYRWKSENVSTNEVSEALGTHPAVIDVNVYGVEIPNHDGRAGCVTTVFNREVDEHLLTDLATYASAKLPRYAVPLFLRVAKEVKATGNNKQQKHVLRLEGVDPEKVSGGDQMFWLREGRYVRFGEREWQELKGGRVKL